jgi:hypothetical protein
MVPRERKKKGERKSKRDGPSEADNIEVDVQRPMAASKSSRAPSSRSESPQMDMPSSRPSSSHRRGDDRERVVRETVSFTKPPPSETARPQPAPIQKKGNRQSYCCMNICS